MKCSPIFVNRITVSKEKEANRKQNINRKFVIRTKFRRTISGETRMPATFLLNKSVRYGSNSEHTSALWVAYGPTTTTGEM